MKPVDEAIVLAGGLGTRLRGIVDDVPKPLAPVAGRPFLAWLLDRLAATGMRRCILATGYMTGVIESVIGTRWQGMEVEYSVESRPLGTGGAISLATARLQGNGVHVLNGDTWLAYSPQTFERVTRERDAAIGIALAQVDDIGRYGAVELDARGMVVGFREKGERGRGAINAGCYFLTDAALATLPTDDAFSFEREVLEPAAGKGQLAGFVESSGFIDIGVPGDYARSQLQFAGYDRQALIRAPYVDPGAEEILAAHPTTRKALFLDRDGVINRDHGYVHTPGRTDWVPGIFKRVADARERGYLVVVVTNQAGIGRGFYTEADFIEYTAWIHGEFARHGAPLLATYWCPHHSEAGLGAYRVACACRKPMPGMLLAAAKAFALDLGGSILVGDSPSDLAAGRAAGVGELRLAYGDLESCWEPAG